MVQTQIALGLIAITLLALTLIYFATIKYVSEVLYEEHDEGNTSSGGRTA